MLPELRLMRELWPVAIITSASADISPTREMIAQPIGLAYDFSERRQY
jgi:hypothetical protein